MPLSMLAAVALLELHVSVAGSPAKTEFLSDEIDTLGAGGGGGGGGGGWGRGGVLGSGFVSGFGTKFVERAEPPQPMSSESKNRKTKWQASVRLNQGSVLMPALDCILSVVSCWMQSEGG
jgi:hypothetical protein